MNIMTEEQKEFSIVESMRNHIKKLVGLSKDKTPDELDAAIIAAGRTEVEKEQLREMCEEEDLYEQRLAELRKSGMQPGQWLNHFIDKELEAACDSISTEAKDIVKLAIMDETGKAIEAQAESLDIEMEQTMDIMKGGQK